MYVVLRPRRKIHKSLLAETGKVKSVKTSCLERRLHIQVKLARPIATIPSLSKSGKAGGIWPRAGQGVIFARLVLIHARFSQY
jgi:hypothetical protein